MSDQDLSFADILNASSDATFDEVFSSGSDTEATSNELGSEDVESQEAPTEVLADTSEELPEHNQPTDDDYEPEVEVPNDEDVAPSETPDNPEEVQPQDQEQLHHYTFKARGKERTVKTKEEVESLLAAGYDYQHKTKQLAEHRRTISVLQRHGITEADLNKLVAIHKKDPAAIKALVAEADIDPYEFDKEEDAKHTPENVLPSDADLDFQDAVDAIKDSPHFRETADLVAEDFDVESKQFVLANPNILGMLHDLVSQPEYYEAVKNEVATLERNALIKQPKLQSYFDAIAKLNSENFFGKDLRQQPTAQATAPVQAPNIKPVQEVAQSTKHRRQRATSATAVHPSMSKASQKDPMKLIGTMSSEDFNKNSQAIFESILQGN